VKTFSWLFYSHFNQLRRTVLHERLCFKGNNKLILSFSLVVDGGVCAGGDGSSGGAWGGGDSSSSDSGGGGGGGSGSGGSNSSSSSSNDLQPLLGRCRFSVALLLTENVTDI
jgi:hypothetical protein